MLESIIHVSHNIILKSHLGSLGSGHYDVIDEIKNGSFRNILIKNNTAFKLKSFIIFTGVSNYINLVHH